MKKALFVATVGRFLGFERNDIKTLQSLGYEVHIATNLRLSEFDNFQADGIIRHQIDFARIPWSKTNLSAYKQLKKLFKEIHFDIVHCHTPMGGVLGRLAAKKYRKSGTKVIYTAHGFHFCKNAPKKNWLMFYPVEWLLAHWTDVLITINEEDYALAKKHMHAKHVTYIPGVGVDLKKFSPKLYTDEEILNLRNELGLNDGKKMILSVGELSTRKNHESVIRALAKVNDPKIKYFICGTGELREYLEELIEGLGLSENVKLLGYRTDISKLCCCADLFVFPSLQEGLPVALMEAIASKTPVICSNIRGNTDLVSGNALFEPKNVNQIAEKICEYINRNNLEEIEKNYASLKKFDLEEVVNDTKVIYSEQSEKFDRGGVTYLDELYKQQQLKKSLGLPLDSTIFLSVGELDRDKNHILMIKALQLLRNDNYKYIVCGVGALKEEHEKYIHDNNLESCVKLLGFRSDIAEMLQITDVFVFPSTFEGLSVALMEAIASKVMVICSASRGNTDLVKDKRCLFDYRSVDELIQAIHNVENMTEAERNAIIEDNYSRLLPREKSAVIERMKEIYKETEAM